MRKVLQVALVALLAALSGTAGAAGALTQQKCSLANNATTFSLTFDAGTSTASGTVIVACLGMDGANRTWTTTDDASSLLTWTEDFEQKSATLEFAGCWSASGTSSITQVDFTFSGNTNLDAVCIYEFSGLDYSSRSTSVTTVTDNTAHSSGNVTAETDGVMVGVYGGNTADFGTASSPWTNGIANAGASACTGGATTDCRDATQYRLVASGGSLDYAVTAGAASRDSVIGVIEFGPAAAGGGTTTAPVFITEMEVHQ